jgi:hypothetical protein
MIKIGDIVRGKGGSGFRWGWTLGIVVGYWKAGDKQQPLVKWLGGDFEGETSNVFLGHLEVVA